MFEAIIEQIILLKTTLITCIVGTFIVMGLLLFLCRRFDWNSKTLRVLGFFYDARKMDSVILATCLVKLFLVISLFFNKGVVEIVHIALYGGLVLVYNVLRRNFKEMLISVFNGLVTMGVLYVVGFLTSYLKNVLFDWRILVALIFLSIFLVLYSLYDLFWSVQNIVTDRLPEGMEPEKDRVRKKRASRVEAITFLKADAKEKVKSVKKDKKKKKDDHHKKPPMGGDSSKTSAPLDSGSDNSAEMEYINI